MARRRNPWPALAFNSWALGFEMSAVIALRTMKIAAGGSDAETETARMLNEKVDAALALQRLAMTGALGFTAPTIAAKTIRHYRRKVRANKRRLQKR